MSRNDNLDYRGKPRVQTTDFGPSLTVQSDAKAADINEVLRRFEQVGIVEHLRDVDLQFADVSEFTDYADLMRNLRFAEERFMELPSKVREVFGHDVAKWLDAAHNTPEQNAELFEKFGVNASGLPLEKPTPATPAGDPPQSDSAPTSTPTE